MELFNIVTIKGDQYVQADELFEHAPLFCKKSRSTRALMENKAVPEDMCIFAKLSKKTEGKWLSSDGSSVKMDQR